MPIPPAGPSSFPLPDVFKLPSPAGPVPIPYPNVGTLAPSTSSATKVNMLQSQGLSKSGAADAVAGKVVTNPVDKAVLRGIGSQIPASTGDEAGAAGGVVSGVNRGNLPASKVVFKSPPSAGGAGAGAQVAPSQTKIMVDR